MSVNTLSKLIREKNNPTVAGLDARLEYIPDFLRASASSSAEAVLLFNKALIDALSPVVPAVKPQSAYYELLGPEGGYTLKKTIDYAHEKGMYVIVDAKRGDIGATASAYAESYLTDIYGADSMTVNPYFGIDGVEPFLKYPEKSIFLLVKTSNKSSGDFQDRVLDDGRRVYDAVAAKVAEWGKDYITECGYSEACAVVGATYPEEITYLRERYPRMFFLVPGYGAQGGKAEDVARAFDSNGGGAIINSSRAIMCAWKKTGKPEYFAEAARAEAERMRDEINSKL